MQNQFQALLEKIDPQPSDIGMPALPIVLLINLGVGCTSVIAKFNSRKPESLDENTIIDQIQKHSVNRIVASPFLINRLSSALIKTNKTLPTVEKIFTGGAPVFPTEAQLYNEAFPSAKVEIVYGSTEAEPISSININELLEENINSKGLNVGLPYHGTTVKIIQLTDQAITCTNEQDLEQLEIPIGQIGEIVVAGSHVLREYYNNEEALLRNKIFIDADCWHRTGDSGYMDPEGRLFLTGRCNSLVTVNEELFAPFIFEHYFQGLEGVVMGTILKIDDQIVAMIELEDQTYRHGVHKAILENNFPIDSVRFINKMPRDPRHHSKIEYGLLREMVD